MADRIVSITERALTTTVDNIEHIESQSLYGIAVVKVFLQRRRPPTGYCADNGCFPEPNSSSCPRIDAAPHPAYSASSVPRPDWRYRDKSSEQELNDYGLNSSHSDAAHHGAWRFRAVSLRRQTAPGAGGSESTALQSKGLSALTWSMPSPFKI